MYYGVYYLISKYYNVLYKSENHEKVILQIFLAVPTPAKTTHCSSMVSESSLSVFTNKFEIASIAFNLNPATLS